jgi:hypothetical protein
VIIGKDAQIRHTVVGNGDVGVSPVAFLVQLSFGVATSERNWRRTHGGLLDPGLSHLLDARDC